MPTYFLLDPFEFRITFIVLVVDEQIKRMIKNVNQQNKQYTTPSSQQTYIKLFIVTKCTTIINPMKK